MLLVSEAHSTRSTLLRIPTGLKKKQAPNGITCAKPHGRNKNFNISFQFQPLQRWDFKPISLEFPDHP